MVWWSPLGPTNPLLDGKRTHAHLGTTSLDLNIFNGNNVRPEYCLTTCFTILVRPNIFPFVKTIHTKIYQQHQEILKAVFWQGVGQQSPFT